MDRQEADAMLRQAVVDHAVAYGHIDDGDLLSEFVAVAAWIPAEHDSDPRIRYTLELDTATMAHHHVLGLLVTAKDIQAGMTWDDEEDG